jgi:hypothetical protein
MQSRDAYINRIVATCFGYILDIFNPIPDKSENNAINETVVLKYCTQLFYEE